MFHRCQRGERCEAGNLRAVEKLNGLEAFPLFDPIEACQAGKAVKAQALQGSGRGGSALRSLRSSQPRKCSHVSVCSVASSRRRSPQAEIRA